MNVEKRYMKYLILSICKEDFSKVNKILIYIKYSLCKSKHLLEVYRKLKLTSTLVSLLKRPVIETHVHILDIFSLCLCEESYRKELHERGLTQLVKVLHDSDWKVRIKACKVLAQQCVHQESLSRFHNSQVVADLTDCLKNEAAAPQDKEIAVTTCRYLVRNRGHLDSILEHNAVKDMCENSFLEENENLISCTLQTIAYFCKWPSNQFFDQLLLGTDYLNVLSKVHETHAQKLSGMVLRVLLAYFCHYSSASSAKERSVNSQKLDYLNRARFCRVLIEELNKKEVSSDSYDEVKLIKVLCQFCSWGKNCRFSPFIERTWHELIRYGGLELLVSLVAKHKSEVAVLESVFGAILTLEYLHSDKLMVLRYLRTHLLPLVSEIFDWTMIRIREDDEETFMCNHSLDESSVFVRDACKDKEMDRKSDVSFDDKSPIALPDNKTTPIAKNLKGDGQNSVSATYRKINNIKFRTGRKKKTSGRTEPVNAERSSCVSVSDCEVVMGVSEPTTERDADESQRDSAKSQSVHAEENTLKRYYKLTEYLIRLLNQVCQIKEIDAAPICQVFLMKIFEYISDAKVVHPASFKFLRSLAGKSSSIQCTLDNLFIPRVLLELPNKHRNSECRQCAAIRTGAWSYVAELRQFFNHHHLYGQYEIANRIRPSESDLTRNYCLIAVTHVITCPKYLRNFLVEHKGLDSLAALLCPESDAKTSVYALAAMSSVVNNLRAEYSKKFKLCLLCDVQCKYESNSGKLCSRRKEQVRILISSGLNVGTRNYRCLLDEEEEKNCLFRFKEGSIHVNKEKLSAKNDVINTMMFGSFVESKEDVIEVSDVSFLPMQMIIHFIYGCNCSIFFTKDVSSYADLLFLAGMYFLPELKIFSIHRICDLLSADKLIAFMDSHDKIMEIDDQLHFIQAFLGYAPLVENQLKDLLALMDVSSSIPKSTYNDRINSAISKLLAFTENICNCDKYCKY